MDKLAKFNKSRWEALAQAGVQYSRPFLELTPATAVAYLTQRRYQGPVAGKEVLILAGGGGQQSAVFALLDAHVTILDLTETQLARDREAAAHYGKTIRTLQGDMRDLSRFENDSFDIVWHPYSINFVPDPTVVIREVSRVLRPGGFYWLQCSNPFWSFDESDWTDKGYPIRQPYVNGTALMFDDPHWEFDNEKGEMQRVRGPHEFLHTLRAYIDSLADCSFLIKGMIEGPAGDIEATPGSWAHMCAILPPFYVFLNEYRP